MHPENAMKCPTCGAEPDAPCVLVVAPSMQRALPHRARSDVHRVAVDLAKHRSMTLEEAVAAMPQPHLSSGDSRDRTT